MICSKYKSIICVLMYLVGIFVIDCSSGDDVYSIELTFWPDTLICGIETFVVGMHYYIPEDHVGDNREIFVVGERNNVIMFSTDTIILEDVQWNKDGYNTTLTWVGYVPSANNYYIEAVFRNIQMPRDDDSTSDKAGPIVIANPTDPCRLKKWCGDERYGNKNDQLVCPAAYPIYVQVVNVETGIGINGEAVSFNTSGGTLFDIADTTAERSIPFGSELVNGLAYAHLEFPNSEGPYMVTVTYNTYTEFYYLHCVCDTETVQDDSLIHECWDDTLSPQISGDGYWLANDPSHTSKNLKLEVDYNPNLIDSINLTKVLNLIKDSLFSQINIEIDYTIDDKIYTNLVQGRWLEKALLADCRDYGGIGEAYLHVVFVGAFSDTPGSTSDCMGRTVTYRDDAFEDIGGTTCARYASGALEPGGFSEAYLDSVGCVIYVETSCLSYGTMFIDSVHVLAIVAAHEIGHALGLGHTDEYTYSDHGIMSYPIDVNYKSYSFYAYFAKPNNIDYGNRWLINLRKILGRETVDINW